MHQMSIMRLMSYSVALALGLSLFGCAAETAEEPTFDEGGSEEADLTSSREYTLASDGKTIQRTAGYGLTIRLPRLSEYYGSNFGWSIVEGAELGQAKRRYHTVYTDNATRRWDYELFDFTVPNAVAGSTVTLRIVFTPNGSPNATIETFTLKVRVPRLNEGKDCTTGGLCADDLTCAPSEDDAEQRICTSAAAETN